MSDWTTTNLKNWVKLTDTLWVDPLSIDAILVSDNETCLSMQSGQKIWPRISIDEVMYILGPNTNET